MLLNYINIINGRKCSFCQSISVRLFVFAVSDAPASDSF